MLFSLYEALADKLLFCFHKEFKYFRGASVLLCSHEMTIFMLWHTRVIAIKHNSVVIFIVQSVLVKPPNKLFRKL